MKQKNDLKEAIIEKIPLIVRDLRGSEVRKKIAEYLFDIHPSYSYTSEIAYRIKTTPTNAIGALRGMGTRYKVEDSLLKLNMVEEKCCDKNIRLYGLTPFGKEVMKSLYNMK